MVQVPSNEVNLIDKFNGYCYAVVYSQVCDFITVDNLNREFGFKHLFYFSDVDKIKIGDAIFSSDIDSFLRIVLEQISFDRDIFRLLELKKTLNSGGVDCNFVIEDGEVTGVVMDEILATRYRNKLYLGSKEVTVEKLMEAFYSSLEKVI